MLPDESDVSGAHLQSKMASLPWCLWWPVSTSQVQQLKTLPLQFRRQHKGLRQLGACPRPALLDCHCMFLSKHRMTAIGKAPLFSGITRPKNMNFNISYYLLFLTYQLLPILPCPTANRKKCLIVHLALRPIAVNFWFPNKWIRIWAKKNTPAELPVDHSWIDLLGGIQKKILMSHVEIQIY